MRIKTSSSASKTSAPICCERVKDIQKPEARGQGLETRGWRLEGKGKPINFFLFLTSL
jgi:hypothetical protein